MDVVEVSVQSTHAGYITNTVRGKRTSCTHSDLYAVERLAEKLFPDQGTTIVRVPITPIGRLHSKWRIAAEIK